MHMKRTELDENATFVGLLLGLMLGAVYALLRIKRSGRQRRRDLASFGAASGEVEMAASLEEAKTAAKARIDEQP